MATTSGSKILGSDYNLIQTQVVQIYGSGSPFGPGTASPTFGYYQTPTSAQVAANQKVTAAQWQALANDVNACYVHITGANFTGYGTVTTGGKITAGSYNQVFDAMAYAVTNHQAVASSQLTTNLLGTATYPGSWGGGGTGGIYTTVTVSWANTTQMQYFFNQGGKITVSGTGPNLSGSTQDANWFTALQSFSYVVNPTEYTALTSASTQRYNNANFSGAYTLNRIGVWSSISGATITLVVQYEDRHTASGAGPDSVSAGAGLNLYQSYASGAFAGVATSSSSVGSFSTAIPHP
jgi:hypothetical protein